MQRNVIDLYHSGDLGDTIYAIPAMRRLAQHVHFTLYPNPGVTRVPMDENNANMILPLLNIQKGISADWQPTHGSEGLRVDMAVRRFYKHGFNLSDMHSHYLGHDHSVREHPWLLSPAVNTKYKIVVSRSARYRNGDFHWRKLHNQFAGRACFVGVPWEYENFVEEVGPIDYIVTPTLLEVAQLIAGADIFIGNQSCPRAVAEGLKIPVLVEEYNEDKNTHFDRSGAWYSTYPPECILNLKDETLENEWCRAASYRDIAYSEHKRPYLKDLATLCYKVRKKEGPAVEFGTRAGGSAAVIAWCLRRMIYTWDEQGKAVEPKLFDVYPHSYFELDKNSPITSISLAHIDVGNIDDFPRLCDWVLPRMEPGGIIVFGCATPEVLKQKGIHLNIRQLPDSIISYHTVGE